MITGLPGTGIGGLFYLLLGLWMPFRESMAGFRGRSCSSHRRVVARQLFMALGIIVGMGLMGELIGWLVAIGSTTSMNRTADAVAPSGAATRAVVNYLSLTMFAWVFIVLFGVISSVHVLRLVVHVVAFIRRVKATTLIVPGTQPQTQVVFAMQRRSSWPITEMKTPSSDHPPGS